VLTGTNQPGSQIEIRVTGITEPLHEITGVIRKRNANILSVLIYPDKKDDQYKILVIRVKMLNPIGLIHDLKAAGHDVLWPNLPGISK
jgi:acetoin utilization protein AcuB